MARILIKYLFHLLFPLILLAGAVGCSKRECSPELVAIDSLLESDPDSAYILLEGFDFTRLGDPQNRHYHSLLLAEARYKTFRPSLPEKVMDNAGEYFEKTGDRRNAMRAKFYKGLALRDSALYGKAIVTLLESFEMSDSLDYLYRGKINCAISEAYKEVGDASQELRYALRSLEEYQKLDSLPFVEDMELAVGYALCRSNRFDEGITRMRGVYEAAIGRHDEERERGALLDMTLAYLWNGKNREAKDCVSVVFANTEDKLLLGDYLPLYLNAMIHTGSPRDSIEMVADLLRVAFNELPYQYYINNRDYEKACASMASVINRDDSLWYELQRSGVDLDVTEYLNRKRSRAESEISRLNAEIVWISVSVALAVVVLIILVWLFAVSKKKREMTLLYSLELLIKEKDKFLSDSLRMKEENESLAERNKNLSEQNKHLATPNEKPADTHESDLLAMLFNQLSRLHSEYYLHRETYTGREDNTVLKLVEDQLRFLRESDVMLANLEAHVDNRYGALLADVYGGVKLQPDQRRMVALRCIGMSKEAICQIMGIKNEAAYLNRLSRIIKRLGESESPRKEELIAKLRSRTGGK